MDSSALLASLNHLWDDVDRSVRFPMKRPLLAHYTSLKTIDSMLTSEEAWFSNPLYMNDFEELRYGMVLAANQIPAAACVKGTLAAPLYELLLDGLREKFTEFNLAHAFDVYVFCASEHDETIGDDGLLSMWRGYGAEGRGAAIVFDSSKFRHRQGSPVTIGPVQYLSRTQREEWMKKFCEQFAGLLSKLPIEAHDIPLLASVVFERITQFSLYTKHVGFREEREWRAVYIAQKDTQNWFTNLIQVRHDERGGVAPKFRFRFLNEPNDPPVKFADMVHKIILGPGLSDDLNSMAARRLLLASCPQLKAPIVASSTPYRPRP